MGRSVLVTGGTGSIGSELVRSFSTAGYAVTFQYRSNRTRATDLARETHSQAITVDLILPDAVETLQKELGVARFEFDILVNCAGVNLTKSAVHETTDLEFDATLSVNLVAPFRLIRASLPHMLDRGWGRVINVGSIYSVRGTSNNGAYNASKHGLTGLTKSVALDYGHLGVTCNEICPSAVESELMERIAARKEADGVSSRVEYLKSVRAANPMGRMAVPKDISGVALFLASDSAAFINGVSIPVDGGQTAD